MTLESQEVKLNPSQFDKNLYVNELQNDIDKLVKINIVKAKRKA